MAALPKWIDEQPHTLEGEIYFLCRKSPEGQAARWYLDPSPARTNISHEPKLRGWCGTTNHTALYAHGLARVEKFAKNGRCCISVVAWDSPEGQAALEALGYPSLRGD